MAGIDTDDVRMEVSAFLGPLVLYALTASPDVYVGDSGELSATAFTLGISHPPGYPVYTLMGKAATILPLGSVAFRVNLLSALFGAAGAWGTFRFLKRTGLDAWASLAGGLLLATSFSLWSQSTTAEVYSLGVFLLVVQLFVLVRWLETGRVGDLVALGLCVGLGAAHNTSSVMYGGVMAVGVAAVGWKRFGWTALAAVGAAAVTCVLCYVQLPLRHSAGVTMDWGHPGSVASLFAHASARMYHERLLGDPADGVMLERTLQALWFVARQHGPLLLFAPWGLVGLWRRSRLLVAVLSAVAVLNLGFSVAYLVKDLEVYSLPAHLVVSVLVAWGLGEVVRAAVSKWSRLKKVVPVVVLAGPVAVGAYRFGQCNLRTFRLAGEYMRCALWSVPGASPGVLKVAADNLAFLALYQHLVEGSRPDLGILNCNLSRANIARSWPIPARAVVVSSDPHPGIYCAGEFPRGDLGVRAQEHGLLYRMDEGPSGSAGEASLFCPELELLANRPYHDVMARHLAGNFFYQKAVHEKRRGNVVKALGLLDKAVRADGDNPNMQFNVGLLLDSLGKYARAASAFGKAAGAAQTSALSKKAGAKRALSLRLASLVPMDTAEKHYSAARLVARATGSGRAVRHLEAALKLDPDHLPSLVTLGGIYANQKRYRAAFRLWEKALRLDPRNGYVRQNLSRLQALMKRRSEGPDR